MVFTELVNNKEFYKVKEFDPEVNNFLNNFDSLTPLMTLNELT